MKLFGLIGEKLGHSLSPEIHNKVFKDNNIDGLYNLFSVKKDFENNIVESLKCLGEREPMLQYHIKRRLWIS